MRNTRVAECAWNGGYIYMLLGNILFWGCLLGGVHVPCIHRMPGSSSRSLFCRCLNSLVSPAAHTNVHLQPVPLLHWSLVTRPDKTETKSLGTAQDKSSPRGRFIHWLFSIFFLHTGGRLFYHVLTAHSPLDRYLTLRHQLTDKSLWRKAPFWLSAPFSRNGCARYYHLTLRGHNFTSALCTILNLCHIKAHWRHVLFGI